MKNAFIINAHTYYPFSEGKFNTTLVERLSNQLETKAMKCAHNMSKTATM